MTHPPDLEKKIEAKAKEIATTFSVTNNEKTYYSIPIEDLVPAMLALMQEEREKATKEAIKKTYRDNYYKHQEKRKALRRKYYKQSLTTELSERKQDEI